MFFHFLHFLYSLICVNDVTKWQVEKKSKWAEIDYDGVEYIASMRIFVENFIIDTRIHILLISDQTEKQK